MARLTERRIQMQGERENLFFVDRRKLLARCRADAGGPKTEHPKTFQG